MVKNFVTGFGREVKEWFVAAPAVVSYTVYGGVGVFV